MVMGFCLPATFALDAELLAAYHILEWCYTRGFTNLRVETDSLLLCRIVQDEVNGKLRTLCNLESRGVRYVRG
ncbi:hypothetical protein LIER_20247 [Lithospermum erythrorhizon]|uniref:RNase H type-1 domain-containing protein n=1 Tax=Lithospermum erythrorhizon TaxID=34254 RepID=A0AAV3QNS7_LITER